MKAAVVMHAEVNIRLNALIPGLMHTPYIERLALRCRSSASRDVYMAPRNARMPMGKMRNALDVANTVLLLVSAKAEHNTGLEIVANGSITASTEKLVLALRI